MMFGTILHKLKKSRTTAILLTAALALPLFGAVMSGVPGMGKEVAEIVEQDEPSVVDYTPPPDLEENGEEAIPEETDTDPPPRNVVRTKAKPFVSLSKFPIYKKKPIDPDIINILIVGDDAMYYESRGRSDTMIVLSWNRRDNTVKLLSLLRDTLAPISSNYGWQKLNAAYAIGGVGLCVNTINDVYGLDIQKYVTVRFEGVTALMNKLGGLDLNLTKAEAAYINKKNGSSLSAGSQHLSGSEALWHARNRSVGNDFNRTHRQQQVLIAAFNRLRVMAAEDPLGFFGVLSEGYKLVFSNLSLNESLTLAGDASHALGLQIASASIPADGTWSFARYKGMSVVKADLEKNRAYVHSFLYENAVHLSPLPDPPETTAPAQTDAPTDETNAPESSSEESGNDTQPVETAASGDDISAPPETTAIPEDTDSPAPSSDETSTAPSAFSAPISTVTGTSEASSPTP